MEKIDLHLPEGTKELILRQGEAEKIQYERPIKIAGILAAPFQFYENKELDPATCHLQIRKDIGEITLFILDTDPNSMSQITGSLKKDGYFQSWGINTDKRWTVSELLKHLKMQRTFFTEKSECDALVLSLQTWNAKVETVIKQYNDNAGNSLSMLERNVSEIGLKTQFSLTIPIFQGYPKQKFTVEIGFDARSNQVDLYLFSNELFELEIDHRNALIETELKRFSEFKCSKVVIS